jgi:hypothetical protein
MEHTPQERTNGDFNVSHTNLSHATYRRTNSIPKKAFDPKTGSMKTYFPPLSFLPLAMPSVSPDTSLLEPSCVHRFVPLSHQLGSSMASGRWNPKLKVLDRIRQAFQLFPAGYSCKCQ